VPYRFIEDAPTADVGFVATGATLADCFRAAADATLAVMLGNRDCLGHQERRAASIDAVAPDLALLRLLEEIVYYKDAEGLFLAVTAVDVREQDGHWHVDAALAGEPIDPARHQLAGDVKAITMHKLRVARTATGWEATVVVDV